MAYKGTAMTAPEQEPGVGNLTEITVVGTVIEHLRIEEVGTDAEVVRFAVRSHDERHRKLSEPGAEGLQCVARGEWAEAALQYLEKGSEVMVRGSLKRTRQESLLGEVRSVELEVEELSTALLMRERTPIVESKDLPVLPADAIAKGFVLVDRDGRRQTVRWVEAVAPDKVAFTYMSNTSEVYGRSHFLVAFMPQAGPVIEAAN